MIYRVAAILIFMMLFTVVPSAVDYYAHLNSDFDRYIEFDAFHASNVPVGQNYSEIFLTRTPHGDQFPSLQKRLVLIKINGEQPLTNVFVEEVDIESPQKIQILNYKLPADLETGTYKWVNTYRLDVGYGIEKSQTIETNEFIIYR